MNHILFAAAALAAASSWAADITSVLVRQQWPWSTDVKVEYSVSGNDGIFDLQVEAYDGATRLDSGKLDKAMRGERYAIAGTGVKSFYIDPVKAFGTGRISLADFKVKLMAVETPLSRTEPLYRVYDLDSGTCQSLSPAEIMNHPETYGTYETDYGCVGSGFATPLPEVFVWTGVTNDVAYKTSKLVMRRIPAKDVVWQCGSTDSETGRNAMAETPGWIKLTQDYYIGVFELTQAQYRRIATDGFAPGVNPGINAEPSHFKGRPDSDVRPLESLPYCEIGESSGPYSTVKGYVHNGEMVYWPTNSYLRDVPKNRVCGLLRAKFGVEFDIPTEAQWEFACRAGTTTSLYSGKATTPSNAGELGWHGKNSGAETHPVGLLPPNAFGLFDMYGNVFEFTRNRGGTGAGVPSLPHMGGSSGTGATQDDPAVDPVGCYPTKGGIMVVLRGGCWYDAYYWSNMRSSARISSYGLNNPQNLIGVRLVCPVEAQWAEK